MMLLFLRNITPRGWLALAVVVLALFVLGQCVANGLGSAADGRKRAEAARTMAEGRTAAAGDASAIRDQSDKKTAKINNTVETATDAIRQAPDDRSSSRIARRSVCLLDAGASPDCRVLLLNP